MQHLLCHFWHLSEVSEILGEAHPVVIFRKESGQAVAMADRCPHRFAPLSLGRVVGDAVECGYHGLTFDCSGRCIRNPTNPGCGETGARKTRVDVPRVQHPRAPGALGAATHRAQPARARLAARRGHPSHLRPGPRHRVSAPRGRGSDARSPPRRVTGNFPPRSSQTGGARPRKAKGSIPPRSTPARELPANAVPTAALA